MIERLAEPAVGFGLHSASRAGSRLGRLRSGPFEGPATEKPPALPEDVYSGVFNRQAVDKPAAPRRHCLYGIHGPACRAMIKHEAASFSVGSMARTKILG